MTLAKKNAETLTPLALSLQNMGRSAPKMGKQAMPVIKPKAKWDKLIFLRFVKGWVGQSCGKSYILYHEIKGLPFA